MAKSISPNVTKQERDWMAEDDLRTLTRAEEIKADRKRMAAAKKAGTRVLKEKKQEVKSIQRIARAPKTVPKKKRSGSKK